MQSLVLWESDIEVLLRHGRSDLVGLRQQKAIRCNQKRQGCHETHSNVKRQWYSSNTSLLCGLLRHFILLPLLSLYDGLVRYDEPQRVRLVADMDVRLLDARKMKHSKTGLSVRALSISSSGCKLACWPWT